MAQPPKARVRADTVSIRKMRGVVNRVMAPGTSR